MNSKKKMPPELLERFKKKQGSKAANGKDAKDKMPARTQGAKTQGAKTQGAKGSRAVPKAKSKPAAKPPMQRGKMAGRKK